MGISFQEFKETIDMLAVRRIKYHPDAQVDYFDVYGIKFNHSGSYYIILQGMEEKN